MFGICYPQPIDIQQWIDFLSPYYWSLVEEGALAVHGMCSRERHFGLCKKL
jgi:hypothetical protein